MKDDKLINKEIFINIDKFQKKSLIPDKLQAIVDKAINERKEKYTQKTCFMRILSKFKRLSINS